MKARRILSPPFALMAGIFLLLGGSVTAQTTETLATGQGPLTYLIIDNTTVYWLDQITGRISSVSKSPGGAVTNHPVGSITGHSEGRELAQDNLFLYFSGPARNYFFSIALSTILRASKSGGPATTIAEGV